MKLFDLILIIHTAAWVLFLSLSFLFPGRGADMFSLLLASSLMVVDALPACTWKRNGRIVIHHGRLVTCDAPLGMWLTLRPKD